MEFNNKNVLNAAQNEMILKDATVNASEEHKKLAWRRIHLN